MPNRILKESIWRSPNLAKCSRLDCEFFFRLLPVADDFGCFESDPLILHGKLYPRVYTSITDVVICNHLIALANNKIIGLWIENDSLWCFFINWEQHQYIRNKHRRKTPPQDFDNINNIQKVMGYLQSIDIKCNQLLSSAEKCSFNLNPNPNPNLNLNLKKYFVENSIEIQLSKKLLDLILLNQPNLKKPNLQNWAIEIDRMIRIDKRPADEIELIINWSQNNSFWASNILSTAKLRKQFDQLKIKMQKENEVDVI